MHVLAHASALTGSRLGTGLIEMDMGDSLELTDEVQGLCRDSCMAWMSCRTLVAGRKLSTPPWQPAKAAQWPPLTS